MGKTAKRLAVGTVVAAAAGYVAGVLTAPKSGKETRQDIKNTATHTVAEAEKQLKKLHTELTKLIGQAQEHADTLKGRAKDEIDDAIKKTNVAKEKARELLSALHEGGADDKDLRKAINEANKAIDHLRSYLKK